MKRFSLLPLIILPLCLTSCGANVNNPHISKNGNLIYQSEITYDNAFKEGTFSYIDELIQSEETFIFYLTSSECSHCEEFKSKIVDYIKSTHSLVVKMDIIEYLPDDTIGWTKDFQDFFEKYKEYFFVNGNVLTPQVYISQGLNVATKVSSSRYSTSSMFQGAMNDYVYVDNVSVFSEINSYNEYLKNNNNVMTILLDRSDELSNSIYRYSIKDVIIESKIPVALIEIDESNEKGFLDLFSLEVLSSPIGYYKSGTKEDVHIFDNNFEEGKAFLKQYLS